jgi:hypothetical protein
MLGCILQFALLEGAKLDFIVTGPLDRIDGLKAIIVSAFWVHKTGPHNLIIGIQIMTHSRTRMGCLSSNDTD